MTHAHEHAGPGPRTQGRPHDHPPHHDHAASAALLDLDAEVLGAWLPGAADLVAAHAPDASVVVDLGAGTGTGTLALARRLPAATVVAVDRSPAMLERLRAAAAAAGVGERVRTVAADLDAAWPATGTVDAVWAASSLHHLADPDRVLRDAHAALRPGGVALVVELDEQVRLLTDDLAPGLASRLAQAASTWNVHPDWGPHLERAGFEVLDVHHVTTEAVDSRYGRAWLTLLRTGLAERLAPADVATLDRLLAEHPATLDSLPVRAERTLWLARRPAAPSPHSPVHSPTHSPTTHDGGAR
ncbi:methyltransferase domain-containing protein [Cellulomonas sp.]|uniref:class I SAM-dependent methyltransferase n=1 Tax=Cellulomonas sp. TaxID=40001 RepID=UPI0028124895|nr:methyltransferase domain-containing protein [Cellulomonas sp.]